jgi:hypothetical protein
MGTPAEEIVRTKSYLLEVFKTSNEDEKRELLRPVMENQSQQMLQNNEDLFRIFGPANPLYNQDLSKPGRSNKYGGCRMFLCDVFDYDEEFDYLSDWFTGVCQECHFKIRHRWYAVRKPGYHGGWTGCYCSWDCVRQELYESDEPDLLTDELVNIFETDINRIGIQDRQ